jgi:hypothetical protein
MGFFSKLFGGGKKEQQPANETEMKGIYSTAYFDKRYTAQDIYADPAILDGCLKMVESYFIDTKIQRKIDQPINHPQNLDQAVEDGLGFNMYCKAFNLDDSQIVMFLAYSFAEYLIANYGFKLYSDSEPEYPLRGMTIKYDKNGIFLSLYPFEYSLKVLENQASFKGLVSKLDEQLSSIPQLDELVQKYTNPK